MCMLSFFPAGVMPNETHIQNGADVNPDGHGYAMVTRDNHLSIFRSMNADEVIERFMTAREKDRSGPALFHSRIATSGMINVTGCHPFRVGQDNRTVLAHNGILFSPAQDSLQSDTAIFAERMLPRFGSLDSKSKRKKLARFIGPGNKFVVLTVNPNRRKRAYLINQDQGMWVKGGAWHSNYDYEDWKKYAKYTAPKYGGAAVPFKSAQDSAEVFAEHEDQPWEFVPRWRYEPYPCAVCGAVQCVDSDTLICKVCDTCQDCLDTRLECMCAYPGSVHDNAMIPATNAQLAIASAPHNPL